MLKLIAQGAESKLFLKNNKIIKNRFIKKYRIKEIDEKIRKFRTKREAKVLEKLQAANFPCPKFIKSKKENLELEFIKGRLVKGVLENADYISMGKEIGEKIAIMHNSGIIHGDLTTSNMIFNKKVYFIDFGLSFFSHKVEDKAVDLHLLKEALLSKHSEVWDSCYKAVLESYKNKAVKGGDTLKRVKEVEKRGRYKRKDLVNGKPLH